MTQGERNKVGNRIVQASSAPRTLLPRKLVVAPILALGCKRAVVGARHAVVLVKASFLVQVDASSSRPVGAVSAVTCFPTRFHEQV